MPNNSIPESNHISRYCKPSTVVEDKPQPSAFLLREGDNYLSVDWLEFLKEVKGNCDSVAITKALNDRGLKIKKKGRYALFNIGKLVEYVNQKAPDNRMLSVCHVPRHQEDSHSGIYNSNHDESNIIAVLISQAIKEVQRTQ